MILTELLVYIETKQRVEETELLSYFHLQENGLAPMIERLMKTGHIQKTINSRGPSLPAKIFYSWQQNKVIPMVSEL